MILAATGHRPNKLGGYSVDVDNRLRHLARLALVEYKPECVISGMALGWDMAWAEAAIEIGVPFVAAIPFAGQESAWPALSQCRYNRILSYATNSVIVCDGAYAAWKMQKRNQWMVDNSQGLVALWDGTAGGTANCVNYAKTIPMVNLWEYFINMR